MRKWIIITAVIAGLGGTALGLVGGAYMGFWATRYVAHIPLYERSVSGAADSSLYWQMALEGNTETIRHLARGAALMHAGALNIFYDDLEKGQRMSVDRSYRRILELVERDDEAMAGNAHTIEAIRKRVEESDAGEES